MGAPPRKDARGVSSAPRGYRLPTSLPTKLPQLSVVAATCRAFVATGKPFFDKGTLPFDIKKRVGDDVCGVGRRASVSKNWGWGWVKKKRAGGNFNTSSSRHLSGRTKELLLANGLLCARPVVGGRGRPRRSAVVALFPPASGARVGAKKLPN